MLIQRANYPFSFSLSPDNLRVIMFIVLHRFPFGFRLLHIIEISPLSLIGSFSYAIMFPHSEHLIFSAIMQVNPFSPCSVLLDFVEHYNSTLTLYHIIFYLSSIPSVQSVKCFYCFFITISFKNFTQYLIGNTMYLFYISTS